jgi:ADP-ribosylglycohydrolase
MTTDRKTRANIDFALWGLKCNYGTFVQGSTFGFQMSFCAKNPPTIQSRKPLAARNFDTLQMTEKNIYKDILFGVAVGDALGVPVEFKSRQKIGEKPVTEMIGFGTYNLPAGTFSDDSSLTFCLAEALTEEFSLQQIGNNFIAWLNNNYWTPRGDVFDVGIATSQAIRRIQRGCNPELAGGIDISDNGNGSLMRILPLLVYIKDKELEDRYQITKQVSSITHGHIRSVIACFYYLEFARQIVNGIDKFQVYENLQTEISYHLNTLSIDANEIKLFDRLLNGNIYELTDKEIFSSGYVLHTLEASIWCLLTTDNYKTATLKAVNLGEDTDTTGAVTGGLAGLLYGFDTIPKSWLLQIARKDDIEELADRLKNFASSQH